MVILSRNFTFRLVLAFLDHFWWKYQVTPPPKVFFVFTRVSAFIWDHKLLIDTPHGGATTTFRVTTFFQALNAPPTPPPWTDAAQKLILSSLGNDLSNCILEIRLHSVVLEKQASKKWCFLAPLAFSRWHQMVELGPQTWCTSITRRPLHDNSKKGGGALCTLLF